MSKYRSPLPCKCNRDNRIFQKGSPTLESFCMLGKTTPVQHENLFVLLFCSFVCVFLRRVQASARRARMACHAPLRLIALT